MKTTNSHKWYEIKNHCTDNTDIYLYDVIGGWGVSGANFVKEIASIKSHITLHIHSPGGNVADGIAIYNTLKTRDVTVIIEGMAASMASVVALAGKTVKMYSNALMMIHKPWMEAQGDSEDMRKNAERLDTLEDILIGIYQSKTNLSTEDLKSMLSQETWLTASEALEKGFIDEIVEAPAGQDFLRNVYNFKKGINPPTNQIQENKMNEILSLLGVETESDAVAKIRQLQKTNTEMEADVIAKTIDMDIQNMRLMPSQKDFAIKMLTQGTETYEAYLKTISPFAALTKTVDIPNAQPPSEETYEDLLNNPAEFIRLSKENPSALAELEKKFRRN